MDVPCQDELKAAGHDGVHPETPSRLRQGPVETIKKIDTSAVRGADVMVEFHTLGCCPSASEKSGWSAVTTEPSAGLQHMSQSPAPKHSLSPSLHDVQKANPIGQLTKGGDFAGCLSHPALSVVLNEPNPTTSFTYTHTCFYI